MGDAYYELGQLEDTIAQYKLAAESVNDYTLFAGLGDLYKETEQFDEAAAAYLRASELVPNDIWTQLALYQYLTDMERPDDALIVEERIQAFQARQDEYLKQLAEEQEASEAGAETEVEQDAVESAEEIDGDSDPEN